MHVCVWVRESERAVHTWDCGRWCEIFIRNPVNLVVEGRGDYNTSHFVLLPQDRNQNQNQKRNMSKTTNREFIDIVWKTKKARRNVYFHPKFNLRWHILRILTFPRHTTLEVKGWFSNCTRRIELDRIDEMSCVYSYSPGWWIDVVRLTCHFFLDGSVEGSLSVVTKEWDRLVLLIHHMLEMDGDGRWVMIMIHVLMIQTRPPTWRSYSTIQKG